MKRWRSTAIVAAVGMLWSAPASARSATALEDAAEPGELGLKDPEAQEHLQRGLDLFYAKDFEAASLEFKAAYAIEPEPFLLYSWGQAERYAGNCDRVIDLFNRYIASGPSEQDAANARERIEECGGTVGTPEAEAEPEAPEKSVPVEDTPTVAEPDRETDRGDESRTPLVLGVVALVVGAAAAGGGAGLVLDGRRRREDARTLMSQQQFVDEVDTARSRQTLGWTLVGVGSAVVVTGAVTLGVYFARRSKARRAVAWRPGLSPVVRF